jgi:predicted nucleic acid-binding protein
MVELSAAFASDLAEQKRFLDLSGISYVEPWTATDTELAHTAWHAYVVAKRLGQAAKRPVADLLIGACAANRSGSVTRNPRDFISIAQMIQTLICRVAASASEW